MLKMSKTLNSRHTHSYQRTWHSWNNCSVVIWTVVIKTNGPPAPPRSCKHCWDLRFISKYNKHDSNIILIREDLIRLCRRQHRFSVRLSWNMKQRDLHITPLPSSYLVHSTWRLVYESHWLSDEILLYYYNIIYFDYSLLQVYCIILAI